MNKMIFIKIQSLGSISVLSVRNETNKNIGMSRISKNIKNIKRVLNAMSSVRVVENNQFGLNSYHFGTPLISYIIV